MKKITKTIAFKIDDREFETIIVSLENALSVYIYENKPRLGAFGISVPNSSIMPASTLYVTGTKNEYFVRMIGEKLATQAQKLVLISFDLKEVSNELLFKIMKEVETEIFEEKEEK